MSESVISPSRKPGAASALPGVPGFGLLMLLCLVLPGLVLAKDTVTLQLKWTHAFQFAGYYAAKQQGFYAEAGLDVTIREATPGLDPVAEVVSGRAQYGTGSSSLLLAYNQQQPVVVLAAILQHSPYVLVARRDSPTQSIHDLAGKRVMLEPLSEEIDAYLLREGLSPERIQRQAHSLDIADLLQGRTDAQAAYLTHQPYYLDLAGFDYQIFSPRSAGIDFYGDNLMTSAEEVRHHPERVEAFRIASLRGWEYAMQHVDETIELILRDYTQRHTADYLRFEAAQIAQLMNADLVPIGYMHAGRWQHIASVYAELGMLPKDIPLGGFLYNPDHQEESHPWLYGLIALALMSGLIIGFVALHVYRINRRLHRSLAENEATRHQLQIFSTAIEQSPLSILITGADSIIQYINPFFTRMTGFSKDEAVGNTPRIMQSGLTSADTYAAMWRKLKQGEPWTGELQNRRKSGEIYWEEVHIAPVFAADARVSHYIGLKLDITDRKDAEAKLAASEARLRAILLNLPCTVYQLELYPNGQVRFVYISDGVRDFGLDAATVLADSETLMAMIHPEDMAQVISGSLEAAGRMQTWHARFRMQHPDGRLLWVEAHDTPIRQDENFILCTGYLIDVTERRHLEEQLRASEQKFRTIVESANDIIYTLDMEGRFQYVSPNWTEILGHDTLDFIGQTYEQLIHPDDLPGCKAFLAQVLESRSKQSGVEYRVRHIDGSWRWHTSNGAPLFDADNRLIGLLGIARDISERKETEARILHMAHYDALTDLPNRGLFFDRLQQALRSARRNGTRLALMFIDLDRFKPVNDEHGHEVGDRVLQEAARRMKATLRDSDVVGRIGGDEFVILLPDVQDAQAVLAIAEDLRQALNAPMHIQSLVLSISASIGLAVYPEHGQEAGDLSRHADEAMYQAKQAGRNAVRMYRP